MAESVVYRLCEAGDAPQLRTLWKLVFDDTEEFLDFYFANRFVPAYSVCTEVDGVIVGGIFGLPCAMSVRGVAVKASMSSGFCTHPDHRGKGYFSNLYALYLQVLRKNGVVLAPNTPVIHEAYFRFETRSATRSRYLTGRCLTTVHTVCQLLDGEAMTGSLLACYDRNMAKYSGHIVRSYADFLLRLADCSSDGAKILGILEKNQVVAYAIIFETEDKMLAIEMIADNEDLEKTLLFGLVNQANGRSLEVKLPPDSRVYLPELAPKVQPQGVCALVNVGELLRLVGQKLPISVEVFDPIVPENNGIFNFMGEKVTTLPTCTISSGHLLQGLLGYWDFGALKKTGRLNLYDQRVIPVLLKYFPGQDCFVLEEY